MRYVVRVGERDVDVELDGDIVSTGDLSAVAHLNEVEGTPVRLLRIGDRTHRVIAQRGETRGQFTLWLDGYRYDVEALDERTRAIRALSGARGVVSGPAPLRAPMPGMIVRVTVQVGDQVQPGQSLIVMEAMKMENELRATVAATVRAVLAQTGMAVEKGAVLLELE